MHVLIVNQYGLPAGAAGITRHGDLGRELTIRGHEVTIIASRFNYLSRKAGSGPSSEIIEGVRFRWLDTGTYAANDSRRLMSMIRFMVAAAVAGMRLTGRPDIVIGSSPQLLAGISGLVVAKRFRVPFIFEVRDPWPSALVDLGALRRGGPADRLLGFVEKLLYRAADRVVSPMAHMDLRIAEVREDSGKFLEIPNASAVPEALPQLPTELERTLASEQSSGRDVFLYAGAHGPSNGLDEVLDALTLLRQSDSGAYERMALVFVGDGPCKAELEDKRRASRLEHVHFWDPLPKELTFAAMERANFVLIHFARAEFKRYGMSANKLFDAMSLGKPVLLATPLEDTPADTVNCGIRYEPGSAASLQAALLAAGRLTAEERTEMGCRGRDEANRRYKVSVTGAILEWLLRDVVEADRR